jgi:hypothetical protein
MFRLIQANRYKIGTPIDLSIIYAQACHPHSVEAFSPMSQSGNPIDRHVGARLRMQRIVHGLSLTELGNKIGVTFQQVQKLIGSVLAACNRSPTS